MEPNDSPEFDLDAWVAGAMPALVDVEADEAWRAGYGQGRDVRQPVTALTADDSPLQTFLRAEPEPPEGLSRAERAAFYDEWRAAREAAVEAAQDAQRDHAHWLDVQRQKSSMDALDAMLSRSTKRDEDKGSTRVPVRGAERPASYGRW